MLLANGRAKIDLMFAAMLVLGVLSVSLYLTADFLTRRAFFADGSEGAFHPRAPG